MACTPITLPVRFRKVRVRCQSANFLTILNVLRVTGSILLFRTISSSNLDMSMVYLSRFD
jgi:hypothetical protein